MGQTTTNFTKGKLVQAVRHNYIDRIGWDAIVTENYTYAGKGGAMSRRNTNVLHGPGSADANNFTQSFEYNDLGLVSKLTYPSVTAGDLLGKGPIRDVFYDYTNGYLMNLRNGTTSVASFNYHANGLTSTINYQNGVVWTQGNDPNSIARVGSISATGILLPNGTAATYNLGQFSYDGKGNIKGMGTDRYAYDYLGRLKKGRLTALNGTGWSQEYSYDSFGNLTFIRTIDQNNIPTDRSIPVSASTNRLTNAGYDTAGNQTSNGNYTYGYDSLNMLQSFQDGVNGANQDVIYFYTPNDERIFTGNFKVNGDNSVKKITWSLRDLSGNVLREWFEQASGSPLVWTFSWNKDYFNNGRRTLAEANSSPLPNGMIYYAHDHLGSVRATFNQDRVAIENHTYLPFAEEAILFATSSTTPKSFTGHERDLNSSTTKDDDLIYMHARYYNPRFGRFLSVDPSMNDTMKGAAGWSMYSYVRNNPINSVDPDGREIVILEHQPEVSALITRALMRSLSRDFLQALAKSSFVLYITTENLNPKGYSERTKFGKVEPLERGPNKMWRLADNNKPPFHGALMTLDLKAIRTSPSSKDRSGLLTFIHELFHVKSVTLNQNPLDDDGVLRNGKWVTKDTAEIVGTRGVDEHPIYDYIEAEMLERSFRRNKTKPNNERD